MSEIKLSAIKAAVEGLRFAPIHTLHLLDLVERLGKALEPLMGKDALFCDRCCVTIESDGSITHDEKCFIPQARALVLEIKE